MSDRVFFPSGKVCYRFIKEAINTDCSLKLTSKVLMEERSSGITCFLFHVPHAYWKKSSHGSFVASIPANKDEAIKDDSMRKSTADEVQSRIN
jgi:hypothetical protein